MANSLFLIKKGCVRSWFNKDVAAITLQFFFEGETIAALESFLQDIPSTFISETIGETTAEFTGR